MSRLHVSKLLHPEAWQAVAGCSAAAVIVALIYFPDPPGHSKFDLEETTYYPTAWVLGFVAIVTLMPWFLGICVRLLGLRSDLALARQPAAWSFRLRGATVATVLYSIVAPLLLYLNGGPPSDYVVPPTVFFMRISLPGVLLYQITEFWHPILGIPSTLDFVVPWGVVAFYMLGSGFSYAVLGSLVGWLYWIADRLFRF